jgi:hypothetical protein
VGDYRTRELIVGFGHRGFVVNISYPTSAYPHPLLNLVTNYNSLTLAPDSATTTEREGLALPLINFWHNGFNFVTI